ncbi:hypothetical protein EX30DRAFT_46832 [Ascodesmis nigricans]|uniref:Uncharacterized protein n=1 Tax=Ascodesmis nigricans TaxID=341454 RepID=A0A4S2MVM5_9PEZI|nr:hypothetical protein EX30DRAFT_46832 [Ascodesmis nigricans]
MTPSKPINRPHPSPVSQHHHNLHIPKPNNPHFPYLLTASPHFSRLHNNRHT